ncbi:MAG: TetR/AcrR family transcriptional regulator [Pseudomonadota bacterium]
MTSAAVKSQDELVNTALADMRAALERMNPNLISTDDAGWQERKSAQTRVALLEAAVGCLANSGYSKTTTQLVAASAKISRGAMLHHYATKSDLISNVIDYIMYRRMETFYGEVSKLTDKERLAVGAGVEIYWRTVQTIEYQAYLELSVASRTDPELRKVFDKKAQAFDAFWFEQLPAFFPEWADQPREKLLLARDMIVVSLEGLYLNRRIMAKRERRIAVRDFISDAVLMMRDRD